MWKSILKVLSWFLGIKWWFNTWSLSLRSMKFSFYSSSSSSFSIRKSSHHFLYFFMSSLYIYFNPCSYSSFYLLVLFLFYSHIMIGILYYKLIMKVFHDSNTWGDSTLVINSCSWAYICFLFLHAAYHLVNHLCSRPIGVELPYFSWMDNDIVEVVLEPSSTLSPILDSILTFEIDQPMAVQNIYSTRNPFPTILP